MKTVQMGPLSSFKQRAAHVALGLGLAATLAFGAVMPAMAADGDGSVVLSAGILSVAIPATFGFTGVNLTGATGLNTTTPDYGDTGAPTITVVDPTGTSAGWHVSMLYSGFAGVNGENPDFAPTVLGAVRNSGTVVNSIPDTNTDGVYNTALPVPIAAQNAVPVNIFSGTAATTSRGTHEVTPKIEIAIPANTGSSTYTSIFTVSIDTAP